MCTWIIENVFGENKTTTNAYVCGVQKGIWNEHVFLWNLMSIFMEIELYLLYASPSYVSNY